MKTGQPLEMNVGAFQVTTTSNGGHPPEFFAERICDRLISISETAPPELRQQALAYRQAMQIVVLDGIRRAILSDHTTVVHQLRQAGMEDAAALVLAMRR
jgi:hypothetical protein